MVCLSIYSAGGFFMVEIKAVVETAYGGVANV